MNSRKTCIATLKAAASQAKELADYLISQPFDFTALKPLSDAAKTIRDCAQALRNRELWRLGERLIGAAQMDLSTHWGVAELDSTIARISSLVERLIERKHAAKRSTAPNAELEPPEDPFGSLSGTRWVTI